MIRIMARKNYSDEFRRQAVDLHESTPDATLRGIAADLGVSRGTLADWVKTFGTGSMTTLPPDRTTSGVKPGSTETAAIRIARLEAENARLRVNRFQFVADHQHAFEVKRLCEAVEIARTLFYTWVEAASTRAARAAADAELAERIRTLQDPKKGGDRAYGAPRVSAELNDGVLVADRVNHKRVARVMKDNHLAGLRLRRRVEATVSEPVDQKYPDLLKRDFTAQAPNQRYVGDITYLPLPEGHNLYLATVIDCFSRKLAGWQVADHMRTEFVKDALKAACRDRGSLVGAVFHSDHGAVHTSMDFAKLCGQLGVTQSMGAVGTSADNALAESFNATLKRELLAGAATFTNETSCRRHAFGWVNRYNTRRRHTWCGHQPPPTYEAHQAATLPTAA